MKNKIIFYILLILFYGVNFSYSEPIFHGNQKIPSIALTFDACQQNKKSGFDKKIAAILIKYKVPATIFLSGKWVLSHLAEIKFLKNANLFEFGNHSLSHPHLIKMSAPAVLKELQQAQNIIKNYTGKTAKFFRPPFGEYNNLLLSTAKNLGLTTIIWDVAPGDPDKNISAQKIINYVTKTTKNGSIIILHINGKGWHTAQALPQIIINLRKKGFKFVTLTNLLKI